jgi:hypothetical protein
LEWDKMTICPHKDASWPKDFYVVDISRLGQD